MLAVIAYTILKLTRLPEAVAEGGTIPAFVKRMKASQSERDDLVARLEPLQGLSLDQEPEEVSEADVLQERLLDAALEALGPLDGDPAMARQVLRDLLTTPINLTPIVNERGRAIGWNYSGLGTLDRVLAGTVSRSGRTKSVHINYPPLLCSSGG